jgi:cell division protein FtsN
LFLQVASLGSRQDTSFVQWLEAKGYPARITKSRTGASATGSAADQEDSRILIGPFAGPTSLKKAERKLQSAGVLAIETTN